MNRTDFLNDYERTLVTAKVVLDRDADVAMRLMPHFTQASIGSAKEFASPDLLFVKFVFCSEHENVNADYFPRSELVRAYQTPQHKPFNIEHMIEEKGSYISQPLFNETHNTIIGHMVGCALAKKDGTILTDEEVAKLDATDDPNRAYDDSVDIVGSAVLYDFYFPKTVADIEKMAEDGTISVSMEAWFRGFDFFVGDKIVANTDRKTKKVDDWKAENKALLDDWHHGRSVAGRRVSRVLRDVLFGGVAATETPANKDSVFLTANTQKELERLKKRHGELHVLYDANPSEAIAQEHREVTIAVAMLQIKSGELENA